MSEHLVLINARGQYSLWSGSVPVPSGWEVVFRHAQRQACLDHVEVVWPEPTALHDLPPTQGSGEQGV